MAEFVLGLKSRNGVIKGDGVGTVGYVYVRKDAIIENVKGKVMESVLPSIGGGSTNAIPDFTGPAAPVPSSPMPEGTGLGIPNF